MQKPLLPLFSLPCSSITESVFIDSIGNAKCKGTSLVFISNYSVVLELTLAQSHRFVELFQLLL